MITPAFIALTVAAVRVTLAVPIAPIVSASGDLVTPSSTASHTGPIRPISELPCDVVRFEPASDAPVSRRGAIGPQFWPGHLPSLSEDPVLINREPQPGAIGPQFFGPGFLPEPDNVASDTPPPTFTGGPIGPQFFGPGFLPSTQKRRELHLGPLGLGGLGPAQGPSSAPELGPLGLGGLGPAQGPSSVPNIARELHLGPLGLGGLGPAQGPSSAPELGSLGLGGLGPAQGPSSVPNVARELHLGPLGLGGLGPAQGPSSAPELGPLGLGGLGPALGPSSVRRMVRVRAPSPDSLVSRDAIKIDVAAAQAAQEAERAARLQQQQQNQALQAANGGANVDPSLLDQFQADEKGVASVFQ